MVERRLDSGRAGGLQHAWTVFRRTVPFGQAVVLALLVNLVGGALVFFIVPSHESYRPFVQVDHADPDAVLERVLERAGPTFERCRVGPVPGVSEFPAAERADRIIDCGMGPLLDLERFGRVARAEGVRLLGAESSVGVPSPDRIHPGLQIGATLVPVVVALLLLRGVAWSDDLRRGMRFLSRRPYVPLLSPLVIPIVFIPLATVLPAGPPEAVQATQVMVLAYGFVAIVLVAPIFEEAVFRQWAYRRTIDRLPIWLVALGTSWAFMLTHVFNPQVQVTLAYLPTVFVLGLVFFWIRHRSNSISLAILCHAAHNGLMSAGLLFAGST